MVGKFIIWIGGKCYASTFKIYFCLIIWWLNEAWNGTDHLISSSLNEAGNPCKLLMDYYHQRGVFVLWNLSIRTISKHLPEIYNSFGKKNMLLPKLTCEIESTIIYIYKHLTYKCHWLRSCFIRIPLNVSYSPCFDILCYTKNMEAFQSTHILSLNPLTLRIPIEDVSKNGPNRWMVC